MKAYLLTLLATLSLTLPFTTTAGPNLDQASKDVCACLAEPYRHAEKILANVKQAQAGGNLQEMMARQGELLAVISASTNCFADLAKKYPQIDADDSLERQVMTRAEQHCPRPSL